MTQAVPKAAEKEILQLVASCINWFRTNSNLGEFVIALSGGVDSAVVAKAAAVSGVACRAVTGKSPAVAKRELEDAKSIAAFVGIAHAFLDTNELDSSAYAKNDARRCYHCKSHLFRQVESALRRECEGIVLVTGTNADDLGDYRPGLKAAAEHQVRSPLAELGIGKAGVRRLAEHWELQVADKPASPCLASRIAYGVEVSAERLKRIEKAEEYLRSVGVSDCRVRVHQGEVARIEIPLAEISALLQDGVYVQVAAYCKELGFAFVSLDLSGLQSGGLNQLIPIQSLGLSGSGSEGG
ncbi:MAG: ATP-dependent sacrificial sulfur transferase LarE [Planctomycetota bacterium]